MPQERTTKRRSPASVSFRAPRRLQELAIDLPVVRDHIATQQRIAILRAAQAMMRAGLSQNRAAKELGISPARLSLWLSIFRREGEYGLRVRPKGRAKAKRGSERPCRIDFLLSSK